MRTPCRVVRFATPCGMPNGRPFTALDDGGEMRGADSGTRRQVSPSGINVRGHLHTLQYKVNDWRLCQHSPSGVTVPQSAYGVSVRHLCQEFNVRRHSPTVTVRYYSPASLLGTPVRYSPFGVVSDTIVLHLHISTSGNARNRHYGHRAAKGVESSPYGGDTTSSRGKCR